MKTYLRGTTASDVMTKKVITLDPGTTVREIFSLFFEHHIMGAPVVDKDKKVLGIVTERDLALREEELPVPPSINLLGSVLYLGSTEHFDRLLKKKMGLLAADVMTTPALVLKQDTSLHRMLEFMDAKKVNRVPIVDEMDKLVGIVTRTDIIRHMTKTGKNL